MSQFIFTMDLEEKKIVNTRHLFTEYSSSSSELNSKNNLFPTFLKLVFSSSNLNTNYNLLLEPHPGYRPFQLIPCFFYFLLLFSSLFLLLQSIAKLLCTSSAGFTWMLVFPQSDCFSILNILLQTLSILDLTINQIAPLWTLAVTAMLSIGQWVGPTHNRTHKNKYKLNESYVKSH